MKMPKGNEIRAGRSLLGWNPRELARRAKIDLSTVYRVEASGSQSARGQGRTLEKLISALEDQGVEFIDGGVRLVRKPRK
jgi:ribosome-binding protein aMBF1 (putative translation factor)